MSTWDEMIEAVDEARNTLRASDSVVSDMVILLKGRLRRAGRTYQDAKALDALKKELKDWNSVTHTWKD